MMTTPICTGLILPISVSLLMIGMKMMIAGIASTKSPMITNAPTSRNMMITGSVPAVVVIQPETKVGSAQIGQHPSERGRCRHSDQRDRIEETGFDEIERQLAELAPIEHRDRHHEDV